MQRLMQRLKHSFFRQRVAMQDSPSKAGLYKMRSTSERNEFACLIERREIEFEESAGSKFRSLANNRCDNFSYSP